MQFSSTLLENAVNEFARLPGIGKKTALRLVLHLLKAEAGKVEAFSETIKKMRSEVKFCQRCYNVSDGDICSICANSMRKKDTLCVVESIRDVIAIENTQQYNGTYHVLGGIISPLDGIGGQSRSGTDAASRRGAEGAPAVLAPGWLIGSSVGTWIASGPWPSIGPGAASEVTAES